MVFSSVPLYLDHPNWHQLQQPNHQVVCSSENSQLQPSSPPPPQVGGGVGGPIRPGSMVDRARIAKIPQPEAGLKCPRCDSSNTKFCYFNNYNLTQPRHFCKTCRRYWTRGGALRNVPVGGGCRRNKRSKNSSSKSQATAEQKTAGVKSTSASPSSCSADMPTHFSQPPPQLPFMAAALQNLAHYGGGSMGIGGGFQTQTAATGGAGQTSFGFHIGSNSGGSGNIVLSAGGADHWRLPFLTGLEPPANFYPYHQSEAVEGRPSVVRDDQLCTVTPDGSGITPVAAPVKMEENNQGINMSRQFMGISENNQYWDGNTWNEISGLNSSSTTHLL